MVSVPHSSQSDCNINDAEGKVAKLIVSTSDCTSTPDTPECICESLGAGDCLTCMADARCKWKRSACVPAPSSMSEKKRNKIKLSKTLETIGL